MQLQGFFQPPAEFSGLNRSSEGKHLPRWLKVPFPGGERYAKVKNLLAQNALHTICSSGNYPNKAECWTSGTAHTERHVLQKRDSHETY